MLLLAIEKAKASIRAKVEHPFHVIKNLFAYRKVHLQGAGQEPGAAIQPVRAGHLVLAARCEGRVDRASAS